MTTPAAPATPGTAGNTPANPSHQNQQGCYPPYSPSKKFCSKVPQLEEAVFDIGTHVKPDQLHHSCLAVENYIQTTYTDPQDIVDAICNIAHPAALIPATHKKKDPLHPDKFELNIIDYKLQAEMYAAHECHFTAHKSNAWGLIYGQCSPALRNQLEGTTGFQTCKSANNVVSLLQIIESLCAHIDHKKQSYCLHSRMMMLFAAIVVGLDISNATAPVATKTVGLPPQLPCHLIKCML